MAENYMLLMENYLVLMENYMLLIANNLQYMCTLIYFFCASWTNCLTCFMLIYVNLCVYVLNSVALSGSHQIGIRFCHCLGVLSVLG